MIHEIAWGGIYLAIGEQGKGDDIIFAGIECLDNWIVNSRTRKRRSNLLCLLLPSTTDLVQLMINASKIGG